MHKEIRQQSPKYKTFYLIFALLSLVIMLYYLSDTIIHFTTARQFPINSIERFPLTLLIFPAELFSFFFSLYFVYVLLAKKPKDIISRKKVEGSVAVLLPVYNEPKEIVERTMRAVKQLKWDKVKTYLLDDSTNEDDKKNMDLLARKYDITIIRRKDRIGYKAGNINNALRTTVKEDYFVILDADQAPEEEFFQETLYHFNDPTVAFVQVPQHFINEATPLQRAAKTGANIFYRAQSLAKSNDGAMPFCGTNVVVRAKAFREVGGFSYYTSTEDIELGIRMNEKGYKGMYVPKILVHGYTPPDFKAYSSQQYRWANGNLAILRESWLKLLGGNFPFRYQMHMLFTVGWWIIGLVTLVYILVPIISVLTGMGTHHTWLPTGLLMFLFLHVVMGISMIYFSLQARLEGERITMKDAFLQYSLITNSMFIYSKAAVNALFFKRYIGFVTTRKKLGKTGLGEIKWNLLFAALCFGLSIYMLYSASIASDIRQLRTALPLSLWFLFYAIVLASSIIFVYDGRQK